MKTCEIVIVFLSAIIPTVILEPIQKSNDDYSEFLNYGEKKTAPVRKSTKENAVSKVEILGDILKKNVGKLKETSELDIVFLVDASSSVGEDNFRSELKFVKKLLSDVTIDLNHTRVGLVTFSSSEYVLKNVDEISVPRTENNKCLLLNKQLTGINYTGGETYTLGAFQTAKEIFENSRNASSKVLFLITDGFSNGGDPIPVAEELKKNGVTIFTIGIRNGKYKELYKLSSEPGEIHSYLLDSFEEFESLARKALHVDLRIGDYIPLGINSPCDHLCKEGNCCHKDALCTCGTTTGHYSCVCPAGYYGPGLKEDGCSLCPTGYYSDGPNLCTPCPDVLHVTKPPAYGRESCKCKSGFKSINDNQKCEAIKCKKLSEPKHGYFVKKNCDTVVNSACGARCEVGYNLVGTSIRLCQDNGTWTGYAPSCQVRTCEKLSAPNFGSMSCSHSDLGVTYNEDQTIFPVDTVCSFKCDKGKIFIGSKHRTCLPVAKWSGLKATCRQVKCNKIPPVANAKIEPKSCTYGKQAYGKKCTIKCREGCKTVGPKEKSCVGDLGAWNTSEATYCKDVSPPKIVCPKNVEGTSNVGTNYGYVMWEAPNITDNSDDDLVIWTTPPIANLSTYQFLIGQTNVTYFAEDSSKNRGTCITIVTILDTERPIIENCINPPPIISEDGKGSNVTWEEPHIYDNSHHAMVTRSHNFSYFEIGVTTVTYVAEDKTGNKNLCHMNITVKEAKCDDFTTPANGKSECSKKNKISVCAASCDSGFSLPLSHEYPVDNKTVTFICNATENFWYNEDGLALPECSTITPAKEVIQNGTTEVSNVDCDDKETNKLENDLKSYLAKEVCSTNCTITTDPQCSDELEEEKTNVIKRDTTRQRRKKLKINVHIRYPYANATAVYTTVKTNRNGTIYFEGARFVCPPGFVPKQDNCVQCPKGTYQQGTKCKSCDFGSFSTTFGQTSCTACPSHFSTRKLRSKTIAECKKQCPPGTHANKKVLKNSRKLYKKVIERPTLQPFCKSCPIGHYQDDYGKLECLPCPRGYTTHGYGSTDVAQCVETGEEICLRSKNICNKGKCKPKDRIHYECDCPKGYIGSHCEKRIDVCHINPCRNGGSCLVRVDGYKQPQYRCLCFENYFGSYCEKQVVKCRLKCQNEGRCIEYDDNAFMCLCPDGYEDDLCQTKTSVTYCQEDLCQNNSTCVETATTYSCECRNGFIGRRCHLLPCDYKPCPKNAVCSNVIEDTRSTKSSYLCSCPKGWTGQNCDIKVDFCSSKPCLNGGSCSDLGFDFECSCPKPYHGKSCENQYDADYVLVFERFSMNDYVRLPPMDRNLSEVSVCMWLKVTDTFNYGTLISYATTEYDNAFTLTDYTGLILYVNGKYIATDVFLNDGIWHHVCATWRSSGGVYQVYVDGELIQFGSGLSAEKDIKSNGYLIIGQEQDNLGGKFSQSETFVGRMTLIDIWSKVLPHEEIMRHFHDCHEPIYGDVYAWPEFQNYIRGGLKKESSRFCQNCPSPKKINNGYVDVKDQLAHYKCNPGYIIGNNYKNGRKCLKSSKWEGQREPYCRKIYCGFPGSLKNGFIQGNNFYFGDNVTCNCADGYDLIGSQDLTCTENGKWEPIKPTCIGPQCRAFKIPPKGKITVFAEAILEGYKEEETLYDVGTQVEITCEPGTDIVGESVLTCQENGLWDFDPPICKTPRCSLSQLPPNPENGQVVAESLQLYREERSDTVEYSCNIGFKTVGTNTTSCSDGAWTEFNLTCNRISCGAPRSVENGYSVGDKDFNYGDEVSFECNSGYRLEGIKVMTCGDDGEWEGDLPRCLKIACQLPTAPSNGEILGTNYFFGDEITFKCDQGYKLEGSNSLTCTKNDSWSHPVPRCNRVNCGSPGDLKNGISFGRSFEYGDFVSFECNDGYILSGNKSIGCGADGLWTPSKPECIKITCGKVNLDNGKVIGDGSDYKNVVDFGCNEGFRLVGERKAVCGEGGWSAVPSCQKISCPVIEQFGNGSVINNGFNYNDTLSFECNRGFNLYGQNTSKCQADGQWSLLPQCESISCDPVGDLENGFVHGTAFNFNSTISFECNNGFELVGATKSLCSDEGLWVPNKPICLVIPTTTTPTTTTPVTTTTRTTVITTTLTQPTLPSTVITIKTTSQEAYPIKTTVPAITCKSPKIPLNTIRTDIEQTFYPVGSTITFDCVEGHKMLGNNIIRCSKLGRWSRLQGKCRRISCREPVVSSSTKIIGDSYLYEDVVTIVCKTGAKYELKCNKEGIWVGPKDSSC